MKDYYKILEVSKNATQAEIKASYRSLAKKYHPDKSNSPRAAQLFAEINEAYEVLSDPEKRLQYDQKPNSTNYKTYNPQRPATSRSRARSRQRPAYASSKQQVDATPYVPYFKRVSYLAFAISLFLCLDFLLPRKISQETVEEVLSIMRLSKYGKSYVAAIQVNTSGGNFRLDPKDDDNPFVRGESVNIHKSVLLNLVTAVTLDEVTPRQEYKMRASIFANFSFSLIIMLITSAVGTFLKKPPMAVLNFGIVNGVLILIVLYFTSVS